jgi:steroid delta-isomerase-like uncharacterized protein
MPYAPMRRLAPVAATLLTLAGSVLALSGRVAPQADPLSAASPHKELARRWFNEVINQRDLDAIPEIFAPDYVWHGPGGAGLTGVDEVREFAAAILAASDDRRATVHQQVEEDNLVVTRFTSRGHHTGPYRGVEPTGAVWTTEGIVISRIEDGKIAEDWEIIYQSGMRGTGPPGEQVP